MTRCPAASLYAPRVIFTVCVMLGFARTGLSQPAAVGPITVTTTEKPATELGDYVKVADESYEWKVKKESQIGKTSYAELIMTSQTWRGHVWKHQLFVMTPKSAKQSKHALLFITGGGWRDELEEKETKLPGEAMLLAAAAEKLGMPVAVLLHVPQQPMFDDLYEDALISHTFEQYIRTGEADLPLLLPMVKSAVRAMDTTEKYLKSKADNGNQVEGFIVTGASKRGWTTWLSSVVDDRVQAIAPMVIDVLNMPRQMEYMEECWGAQSEQIRDYTEKGLHRLMETERGRRLNRIVDPYAYREQITEPKYLMLGTNDPYWPVDALNIYWNELKGPKHILNVPNAGHGLEDMSRVIGGLVNFAKLSAAGKTFPKMEWSHGREGDQLQVQVSVASEKPPKKVVLWSASSEDRDFRDERWSSTDMTRTSDKADSPWQGEIETPEAGYRAVFGEVVMEGEGFPFHLSTTIEVYEAKTK